MNLAIRGIDGQIAHGDSFHNDRFPDLKADYILANPPFNVSDWRGDLLMMDKRWQFGVPPASNANFAWVQHMIHHLAPTGLAGQSAGAPRHRHLSENPVLMLHLYPFNSHTSASSSYECTRAAKS
jgi:hypothetical protein